MDQSRRTAANAQFKKLQREEDGKKAMSEYEANEAAVRAKTARLKAARLAKEAADAAAAAAAPAPAKKKPKKAAKKAAKKASAKLSDWLNERQSGGRNN